MTESHTPWLVRILLSVNRVWCRAYHQVDVAGVNCVPRIGAGIVACNHISGLDPAVIQSVIARPVVWMMASEYYTLPVLGAIFRTIEAIPVDRDGRDVAATRAAMRALEQGKILGLFPEGGLQAEGSTDVKPFQPGVALLALRSGVPVYPAYLDGTHRGKSMAEACLLRQRAVLTFGNVMRFSRESGKRAGLEEVTGRLQRAVGELKTIVGHGRG